MAVRAALLFTQVLVCPGSLWPFVLLSFCLGHSIAIILIQMQLSRDKNTGSLHTNQPGPAAGSALHAAAGPQDEPGPDGPAGPAKVPVVYLCCCLLMPES